MKLSKIGTASYSYDIVNGIEGLEAGFYAESSTDPKGNVTVKIHDKTGRIVKVIADGNTTIYNYYDNGSLQSVVYPNGYKEVYVYYKDNLLKTLTNEKSDGTAFETYNYNYDAANNMLSKVDAKGTTSYTYDKVNRLLTVSEPGGRRTTYTYTAAGNRGTETITEGANTKVKTYTYNPQNRLQSIITQLNGATVNNTTYTYDNNGNQLTTTDIAYINGEAQPAEVTTNIYDDLNQLVETTTPDGMNIVHTYNGEGIRVAKQVGSRITKYLYEAYKVVLELDGEGNQAARNIYGINQIARIISGQTAYYFYNGHADTTKLIGASGEVLNSYYYDAFGNNVEVSETIDNPYRYSGYQYDSETGTYYLMARMYDPETGRFLQEDTYRGDIKDPLSLNLYTYVHNNPITYDDPTGHAINIAIGAVVGAVFNTAVTAIKDYKDDGKFNSGLMTYLGAAAEGAVYGAIGAATAGASLFVAAAADGAASMAINAAKQKITSGKVNWKEVGYSGVGGALSTIGGHLAGKATSKVANVLKETKVGKLVANKLAETKGVLASKLKPAFNSAKEKIKGFIADEGGYADLGQMGTNIKKLVGKNSAPVAAEAELKLISEYAYNNTFGRSVSFNAGEGGTGMTYKVYQRNDIDWVMVRTTGAKKGRNLTNAEAAERFGLAPILDADGNVATLHHSQQHSVGPLFEASTRYHNISNAKTAPLHPYKGKLNPFNPMSDEIRNAFQKVDSIEYWKTRGRDAIKGVK